MNYNKATDHDKENAGKDRNLVDMTRGGGGQMGEERESWCKESDVNESLHQKTEDETHPT